MIIQPGTAGGGNGKVEIRTGTVAGDGKKVTLNFSNFKPMVVFMGPHNYPFYFVRDHNVAFRTDGTAAVTDVTWIDTGFTFTNEQMAAVMTGTTNLYLAIGEAL